MSNTAQKPKAKGMDRFFDFIERTGNKLPTPFMLFVYLTIATAALSAILSYMGVSVTYMAAGKDGVLAETTVAVKNRVQLCFFRTIGHHHRDDVRHCAD